MANQIRLKRASGSDPSASDLVVGEVALRTDTGKLFTKDDGGSVVEIGGSGGVSDGDKGDITVSNSGTTYTIDSGVVTAAKLNGGLANTTTNSYLKILIQDSDGSIKTDDSIKINPAQDALSVNGLFVNSGTVRPSGNGPLTLTTANASGTVDFLVKHTHNESNGDLLPATDSTDNLGSSSTRWANVYSDNLYGNGANVTNVNATTLDSIDSASFVRSDASDTLSGGTYTFSGSTAEKMILSGVNSPFIRFQEGTTNKAVIQWNSSGFFRLQNQEDGSILDIRDSIRFSSDSGSSFNNVFHEGNLTVGDGGLTQNNFTNADHSKLNGIAASATNVTNNNQLTNGAGYITATLTNEQVQDIVGGMVSGNTESGITVTYQDGDGTLDFAVASQTDNNFTTTLLNKLNGIAASATNVTNNNQISNGAGYVTSSVINSLNASNLSSGTIPDARFPSTLPAVNGSNLTGIASFASGTRMLFQQTSAPTGWTKDTSDTNNRALRVVSGSAGSGGSVAFTTAFSSQGVSGSVANATAGGSIGNTSAGGTVGNHTLSTSQIPSHNHGMQQKNAGLGCGPNIPQTGAVGTFGCNNNSTSISTFNTGGGGSHNHSFSGSSHNHSFSGSAHNHSFSGTAINLAVQYLDVIIASKN